VQSLASALGYDDDQRLLVLSADLVGSTHAATDAGITAMRQGAATTATLMMPGPWARHACGRFVDSAHPGDDVGIHLTLNSELDCFRWGPLTQAPSLLDGDGGFPRTLGDLWDHADLSEARRECRAQIERASMRGIDVTHLATHLGAMQQRPEFFDLLLDLACEFDLPIRVESSAEGDAGFPFRRLAAEEGVLMPDTFKLRRDGARERLSSLLDDPPAGVSEVSLQPALDCEEIRAVDPAAEGRIDDLAVLLDPALPARLAALGIATLGYRRIRDAQRRRRSNSKPA